MKYDPSKHLYHADEFMQLDDEWWSEREKHRASIYDQLSQKDKVWHEYKERKRLEEAKHRYRKGLIQAYGEKCARCGTSHDLVIDHKTPISRGGITTFENLQLLCRKCNSNKRNKLYYEWLEAT